MGIRSYKNGAGGSTGADLAVMRPTLQSGNYWYVGNQTTGASDSNVGTERIAPLATTAQAVTNASAGDTIVFLAGHLESIGTAVTLSKAGLSLIGEGTGTAVPRFTCTSTIAMFDVTAAGVLLDNLYFKASTAVATARVRVATAGVRMNSLTFECGASDTNRALSLITGAGNIRLTNARFTAVAATPSVGMEVVNSVSDVTMDNVVFDGGSFRWSGYALTGTAAITRLQATRLYLLSGSHVLLPTGTTGTVSIAAATGDSRCDWSP